MNVDQLGWPTPILSSVGAEFEVHLPAELSGHLRAVGELFTRSVEP